MSILSAARGLAGEGVSSLGTALGLPEFGLSETIASKPSPFQGKPGTYTSAGLSNPQPLNTGLQSIDQISPASNGGTGTSWGQSDANAQKANIYGGVNDAVSATGGSLGTTIANLIAQRQLGQQGIDLQATNNELAKIQGVQGVLGMVGRGIRSGGVMLANKNASDSSAAQALANAYGQIGRGQLANVGNQYEQGKGTVGVAQNAFDVQQQEGVNNFTQSKNDAINGIVNDATTKLANLDNLMAYASLPDRIALDQEKQNVRNIATQALQSYDQQLQSQMAGITPADQATNQAKAATMATQGDDLGAGAFNYTTQAPLTAQGNTTPSELPIYTFPKATKTQVA